ncbi:trypsin-like peptidase domain-containing protein [Antarctobacter jejuensis]|uniref:trypsin-like peptidase domain-containing protein n=1 Tax=Antarctobacter jejuensis TaxID=1439938 RepID=UPI003FD51DE1
MLLFIFMVCATVFIGWLWWSDPQPIPFTTNLAKLAYAALLVLVAGLLVREVDKVFLSAKPGIGGFQFAREGTLDATRAEALRAMIVQRHGMINQSFRHENALREARLERDAQAGERDVAPLPFTTASLGFSTETLSKLELNVQGINFGKLLDSMRRRVAPPNEITGHVVDTGDGRISAVVRWPRAPRNAHQPLEDNRLMTFDDIRRDSDLAARIACALIWAELVSEQDGAVFKMRRDHYCLWTEALLIWQQLRDKRAADLQFSIDDITELERARDNMKLLIGQSVEYSEIYQLHANLIQIDPSPRPEDTVQIAQSRAIYAAMNQGASLEDARRSVLLASAEAPVEGPPGPDAAIAEGPQVDDRRPMVPVIDGRAAPIAFAELQTIVEPQADALLRIAAATGFLRSSDGDQPMRGTGFIIGPDVVATADFVPGYIDAPGVTMSNVVTQAKIPVPLMRLEFSVGEDAQDDLNSRVFAVRTVLFRDPANGLSLLHVPGLSANGFRAAAVGGDLPQQGAWLAVLGYPANDPRRPDTVMQPGWRPYVKRLMPGQRVSDEPRWGDYPQAFAHDATTAGGTAGAPVVDLATGQIVGLHLGGGSANGDGRRGYAAALTRDFLAAAQGPLEKR